MAQPPFKQVMTRPQTFADSLRRWLIPLGIVLLILFAVIYPQRIDKQNVWNLFFLICLHTSLSQSWNILAGFAGQTSLGHAAFFGIGAFVTRTLWLDETPFALAFIQAAWRRLRLPCSSAHQHFAYGVHTSQLGH